MRGGRLLWRIYLCFFAGTIIALTATTWYTARSIRKFHESQVERDLEVRAALVSREVAPLLVGMDVAQVGGVCGELGRLMGSRVTVILPDGTVVGDSEEDPERMDNHADRPEIAEAFKGGVGISTRFSDTLHRRLMYVALPVRDGHAVAGVARVSLPLADLRWDLRAIHQQILLGGVIVALLFGVFALHFAKRITRPLEHMRTVADRLAGGDLSARVTMSTTDEVGTLARTLNDMAAQLGERMDTIVRQRMEQDSVLSSMIEGVLAVDLDGCILQVNVAAARLLGIEADAVTGRSMQEALRNHALQAFVDSTLENPGPTEAEIVLYDKGEKHIQLHGTPLTGPGGVKIGGLVVLNDITRLKRLETVRRDFVANVSHELKTPMTALKGCVETLASDDPPDTETSRRFIPMMVRHVDRLQAIVEDLLSLSRIEFETERGDVTFEIGPVRDVLQRAVRLFSKQAEAKRIALALEAREDVAVLMNALLLEQAVGNLIDNALKYSPEGTRITLSVDRDEDELRIRVADEGIGIEKEHLDRVFERFYRVDRARSRALGGTGLGLSIVRHIALAHRGSVSAESMPGKGSAFTIHLPLA